MGALRELLAKPDSIRITAPALPRETIERVLSLIRKDVAEDRVRIDTPTQNLENYFLEVVKNAQQAAAQTSGVLAGARVAAYLRGEAEGQPAADKLLERFTLAPARRGARPGARPGPGSGPGETRFPGQGPGSGRARPAARALQGGRPRTSQRKAGVAVGQKPGSNCKMNCSRLQAHNS